MSFISTVLSFLGCDKSLPDNGRWTVATSRNNGKQMIIRFRSETPSGIDIKQYPNLMTISWHYEPAGDAGLPYKPDNERMVLLEDLLEVLEAKGTAFMMIVVTSNGVKEWQWYSRNQEKVMAALNLALSGHPNFPIQITHRQDAEWSSYFELKNNVHK